MPTIEVPQSAIKSYSIEQLSDDEERAQKLIKTIPNIDGIKPTTPPSRGGIREPVIGALRDIREFSDSKIKRIRSRAGGVTEAPLPVF